MLVLAAAFLRDLKGSGPVLFLDPAPWAVLLSGASLATPRHFTAHMNVLSPRGCWRHPPRPVGRTAAGRGGHECPPAVPTVRARVRAYGAGRRALLGRQAAESNGGGPRDQRFCRCRGPAAGAESTLFFPY